MLQPACGSYFSIKFARPGLLLSALADFCPKYRSAAGLRLLTRCHLPEARLPAAKSSLKLELLCHTWCLCHLHPVALMHVPVLQTRQVLSSECCFQFSTYIYIYIYTYIHTYTYRGYVTIGFFQQRIWLSGPFLQANQNNKDFSCRRDHEPRRINRTRA